MSICNWFKKKKVEVEVEEPERANSSRLSDLYEVPVLHEVSAYIKTRGNYKTKSGRAKGLVVHYTAGRRDKGNINAQRTVTGLASRGLGCMAMATTGEIFRGKNHDLTEVAYHAGTSEWRGRTSISHYCMGMEINCAGKLDSKGMSWFKKKYPPQECRDVEGIENMERGKYLMYTEQQEEALIDFCLWQLDVNPEFKIHWIMGHDECAPTRKADPGGSLSMTMPAFRKKLRDIIESGERHN